MHRIDVFKLVLVACAAACLFWGIRTDSEQFRWAGIGLLVAAVVLRFIPRRPPLD